MENNENDFNEFEDNQSNQLSEKEIEEQETHEASAKTAHVVGKAAATYFGGAVGNKIYNVASKTKLGKSIESTAGKALEKSPVSMLSKPAMKTLNKSGVLDVADKAIDAAGSKDSIKKNPQDISNIKNSNLDSVSNQDSMDKLPQNNDISNESKEKKEDKNASFLINLLIKNPLGMLIIFGVCILFLIIFYYIYTFVSDMDLVGTRITSYSEAESISGYCNQIILIKEHDDFTGDPVASIDDVDLSETFTLNRQTVNRWETEPYNLESYIKGVVEAEAIEVHDKKTFEVAAIAARTYALQITNSKCYTWNNKNKRPQYKNPQNFISTPSDSDVASAVSETAGIVITLNNNLVDMNNGNYYDYFCNIGKDKETDEKYYYKMLQENEEERLLIPSDWAHENNAEGKEYSGKYDGQCQQEGMSLFGAKYLLNKPIDKYTTFRILKYYYGYDIEFKRVSTALINSNGCYWWPVENGGGRISSKFGPRNINVDGASTYHRGVDIAVPLYTPIIASNSGQVVEIYTSCPKTTAQKGCGGGWGNHVKIKHDNGHYTNYAHLSDVLVSVGQNVNQGDVIGKSGNSGTSGGPHLHFEVWTGDNTNSRVDPLNFISQDSPNPSCNFGEGSGGVVNTGDNVKSVCLTLKNLGYSDNSVAAVLTNMHHENTKFDPTVRNFLKCLGIAQWCYDVKRDASGKQYSVPGTGRLGNLEALANYDTFEVQLNFMVNELISGSRGNIHQTMLNGGNAADLTEVYCNKFETPGKSTCTKRRNDTATQTNYLNFSKNGCN